ncbi:MAG TPA: hypothetical protein VKP12_03090, partial [Kiloniellaceae bacterium]|nr:hypothetical protein [Kiloniellaceae bacterium]
MAEPHVVTALIRKRAEIAGQLEAAQNHARQLIIDLDHVDALPPRYAAFRAKSHGSFWKLSDPR